MNDMKRSFLFAAAAFSMAVACQKEDNLQSEAPVLMESLEIVITDEMQDAMTDENGVPSYPLLIGEQIDLEYAVTPSEDRLTYPGVVWTSSNAGVASVDENGRVTAISAGYTVITLSPSNDENDVPLSTLRIEVPAPPVPVEGITVSVEGDGPGACFVRGTIQLAAAVVPENADNRTVTWTTSNAEVATVNADGLVTGVSAGEAKITATAAGSDSENPVKGEITVYVENNVELSFTNVENSALTLPIGGSFAFETEISDGVTGTSYTWESSSTDVASVSDGVLSVLEAFGTTTVTVTCTGKTAHGLDFTASAEANVTVPAGFYWDDFSASSSDAWFSDTADAVRSDIKTDVATGENYFEIYTVLQSNSKYRADLKRLQEGLTYLTRDYPVITIRVSDPESLGVSGSYSLALDTNNGYDIASGNTARTWYGRIGGSGNGRWQHLYDCSDGTSIYLWNIAEQDFQNSAQGADKRLPEGVVAAFDSIKLIYADMLTAATYRFYWFKTFESQEAFDEYVAEWSAETGISYSKTK